MERTARAPRLMVPDGFEEFQVHALAQGWSDGLPLMPSTPDRVEQMLSATRRPPDEVVGRVAPAYGAATVEMVAANAVMAGCRPEYLPVVLAAVEAICQPQFNLYGIQTTTNPATPAFLVNGPIAARLGINGAGMAFGYGFPANATIGRAVRLVMLNAGGARPQVSDKATHGQPGMYTFCFAENEEASPWPTYHRRQGFSESDSTVTAFSVCALNNVLDAASTSGIDLLRTIVSAMAHAGTNNVLLKGGPLIAFCPEHAALLARDGYTPELLQRFLFEHARVPVAAFSRGAVEQYLTKRRDLWVYAEGPGARVPAAGAPGDFALCVVGGAGQHSVIMPSFNESLPTTVKIAES